MCDAADATCIVCLADMAVAAYVAPPPPAAPQADVHEGDHCRLACGHAFHTGCLLQVLRASGRACPLCRGAPAATPPLAAAPVAAPRIIPLPRFDPATIIPLPLFDPATLRGDAMVHIIGARATGKTTLIKDLLRHKQPGHGLVFNPTEAANSAYAHLTRFVYARYDAVALQALLAVQAQQHRQPMADARAAFLVLDDAGMLPWRDDALRRAALTSRHYRLLTLVAGASCMHAPPQVRGNFDYVFVFPGASAQERHRLHQQYAGHTTIDGFCAAMDACGRHECLVLNMDEVARWRPGDERRGMYRYTAALA